MSERVEENRKKAPISTAFAQVMKEVFDDVKLIRVKEGEVQLGKPDENVYATCFMTTKKRERRPNQR